MDLATLRARLPGMTRGVFGERVTLRPMKAGKMASGPDPDRQPIVDIAARMDMAPDIEQMGGGRERPEISRVSTLHASASFDRAALAWLPQEGDQLDRIHPVSGAAETYLIIYTAEPIPGVWLAYLSRLS